MASSQRRAMKSSRAILPGRDAHNDAGNLASAWSSRTRNGDGAPGGSTTTWSTCNVKRSNRYSPSSAWYAWKGLPSRVRILSRRRSHGSTAHPKYGIRDSGLGISELTDLGPPAAHFFRFLVHKP